MFYGDGRDTENPQDFLKMVETSFDNNPSLTGEAQCKRFRRSCHSGFKAEEWYDALPATDKLDWDRLLNVFNLRWPTLQRAKSSVAERRSELRAEHLDEATMLTKVEKGGVLVYKYIAWIDKVEQLAASCNDPQGVCIAFMHETLLKAMQDVVDSEHASWLAFATVVRNLSVTKLCTAIAEENRKQNIEDHMRELDAHRHRPTTPIMQHSMADLERAFGRVAITNPPVTTRTYAATLAPVVAGNQTPGRTTRIFASYPALPQTPAQTPNPVPPATRTPTPWREPRVRLVDLQRNTMPHYPNTAVGRATYQDQVTEYQTHHGNSKPDEHRPYPLTPGTLPVNTGACFACGTDNPTKHQSFACPNPALPDLEHRFRTIAAVCHGIIRGPAVPAGVTPTPVHIVEVTDLTPEALAEMAAEGAVLMEIEEEKDDRPPA